MEARNGLIYRLFRLAVTTGTHLDAPLHYCRDGASVEQLPLQQCMGRCQVEEVRGEITVQHVRSLLPLSVSAILWKDGNGLFEHRGGQGIRAKGDFPSGNGRY